MSNDRERRRRRRDSNAKALQSKLFRQRVVKNKRRKILDEIKERESVELLGRFAGTPEESGDFEP